VTTIAERLELVRERLRRVVESAGRADAEVRLVAVSKTQPADAIRAAYAAGQRDFGENYVQELQTKAEALADLPEIRWHMLGHLQRNKARQVVRHAALVHSVDSAELASELGKRWRALPGFDPAQRLGCLIEVNIAGEAQKSGVAVAGVDRVARGIEAVPELRLAGLMCIPPFAAEPEASRPHFEALARLSAELGGPERLPELSMGMSGDYEVAVRSGSTLVRVGTAIFGQRPLAKVSSVEPA